MKKTLTLICAILMLSTPAFSIDCAEANGITLKGNNGTSTYCRSRLPMKNWWSALGWCQSIGQRPVHPIEDCACTGEKCPTAVSACPNLHGIGEAANVWTGSPHKTGNAYLIGIHDGNVSSATRIGSSSFALCKH